MAQVAPSAAVATNEDSMVSLKDSPSPFRNQDLAYAKRTAGRKRQEGTVVRVVRAVTGSAVRPLLVSQSSLPAVDHAAPTKPNPPPAAKTSSKPPTAADTEAAAAAAEHTAMLKRFRAEWQITEQDSLMTRMVKHMDWRMFWIGHITGLSVVDYEERVVVSLVYLAVLGVLLYEGCRRLMWGLDGWW